MKRCPNCTALLLRRPCPVCGWPDSTRPAATEREHVHAGSDGEGNEKNPGCLLFSATAASFATYFFHSVGSENDWTSDGPGMLLIWMGFGGFGLLAIACWALLAKHLLRR